jgi:hypothetical protein
MYSDLQCAQKGLGVLRGAQRFRWLPIEAVQIVNAVCSSSIRSMSSSTYSAAIVMYAFQDPGERGRRSRPRCQPLDAEDWLHGYQVFQWVSEPESRRGAGLKSVPTE